MLQCNNCGDALPDGARFCSSCGSSQDSTKSKGASSNGPLACGLAVLGVFVLAFFLVPLIGVVAAIAIPNFIDMQQRAKRAEVPANVDGIRTAQLAYDAAFDEFVYISEPVPRSPDFLDGQAVPWNDFGGDFGELGWAPDGHVRGTYWVESGGSGIADFTVHGMIDADGDGWPAHYTATKSISATMVTFQDTY